MSVQVSSTQENFPFILSGSSLVKDNEIILKDTGRTTDLVAKTLMAKNATTGKWEPFTNEAATDGTATARGIYVGDDIAAADIVAADVTGAVILVGGNCTVDSQQLVIENSKTLATVVAGTTVNARTVEDDLASFGIFVENTIDIDELEN